MPFRPNFNQTLGKLTVLILICLSVNLSAQTFDWVKTIPFSHYGIAADNNNNIYLIGAIYNTSVVFNDSIITNGESDVIVAKYTSGGYLLWYKVFGGPNHDDGLSIKVDSNNDIIITVMSHLPIYIGNDTITSPSEGRDNSTIIKLSSSGEYLWGIIPGYNPQNCFHSYNSIVDRENNIYTGGNFYLGSGVFPDTTVYNSPNQMNFITKYNSNGEYQWVKLLESGILEYDVDYAGNLLVVNYDPQGESNNYVINKYNPDGVSLWSKELNVGILHESSLHDNLGFDYDNNFYITASFKDTVVIENETFIPNNQDGFLLLKFNPQGQLVWANIIDSPKYVRFNSLELKNNIISLVGTFRVQVFLHNESILSHNRFLQGFLAQFNTDGNLLFKKSYGGERSTSTYSEFISINESIYISGSSGDSVFFDNIMFSGGSFLAKIDGVIGIEEPTQTEMIVDIFPNPFLSTINIKTESKTFTKVELFDLQGIKINEYQITNTLNSINLESLPSGSYILKFSSEDSVLVKKIIKM